MIYLYCRVSTDRQENGRDAQVARLREWAAQHNLAVDHMYVDEDVSAFSTPLSARPAGKALWDALAPGDTVLMTKVDRGFRSWADAADTHAKLRALGVTLRFADLDIDLATPQGELFFSQIVAFAQFESRMHGQRKREVYAHKRQAGLPYSCTRPYGWQPTRDRHGKLDGWEPLPEERELGQRVLQMREAGRSWFQIASDLSLSGVRKPATRRRGSGYYLAGDVRSLAKAASAGYPVVPQGSWRASGSAPTRPAATARGSRR